MFQVSKQEVTKLSPFKNMAEKSVIQVLNKTAWVTVPCPSRKKLGCKTLKCDTHTQAIANRDTNVKVTTIAPSSFVQVSQRQNSTFSDTDLTAVFLLILVYK